MSIQFLNGTGFNVNLFITLITYILFFFIIIGAALKGYKRGLVKSSIRLGTLIVFLIVAGLVSLPITKALMGIDASFLGIKYNGQVASSFTEAVKFAVYGIDGAKALLDASPSLLALIEGLPTAILNVFVFFILVWVFRLISYIVYLILQRYALKSSRLEKAQKKQAKKMKKAAKKGQAAAVQSQVVLNKKPRKKWWGLGVGFVQGIVLAFVLFLPFNAIAGMVGDLTTQTSIVVEAETTQNENLNEKTADLIRYYVGDETLSYFESYNSVVVTKVAGLGGFDNVIFDELTKVNLKSGSVSFRKEILMFRDTFDSVMEIFNFAEDANGWKDLNFNKLDNTVNTVLDSNLLSGLIPEIMPYVLENYVYSSEMFTELPGSNTLKSDLTTLKQKYEDAGFMNCFKADINYLLDLLDPIFKCGLADDVYASNVEASGLETYLNKNDGELNNLLWETIEKSDLFKVAGAVGFNYAGEIIADMLDTTEDLSTFKAADFNSNEIQNLKDVLDSILAGLDDLTELGDSKLEEISDNQVESIATILTALQNNTFKNYNNANILVNRENITINKETRTVENGGAFSKIYITLVDHYVGEYITNPAYKNADWHTVLKAVQSMANAEGTPELDDIMNVIALDETLGESAKNIAESLVNITTEEELSNDEIVDLLDTITDNMDNLDEEEINNLISKAEDLTGSEDLSSKISYDVIQDEKAVASEISGLVSGEKTVTNDNADEILNSLKDSEFIVGKVAENVTIAVDESVNMAEKIDALTDTSEETKANLKSLFGVK